MWLVICYVKCWFVFVVGCLLFGFVCGVFVCLSTLYSVIVVCVLLCDRCVSCSVCVVLLCGVCSLFVV